ncbi:AmmeMemoRadiSam system protein A [Agathobaculum sp. Marseille-P7918]|uniref:AmmeMemoRadiSam system protein A n=1 Tax=Agathobaculum sp. Marseille-P7918 TaxID=2479843 RepID=UPI000F62DADC|nr:AmmeMemoRadiSam system protein A [Agathobaculum sp. Marseille-P7918]
MTMLGAVLTPHPPVLLPEVGRGREKEIAATDRAMRAAAEQVTRWKPDVLIVASPHTILYGDYFHISPGEAAVGDMSAFGAPQVRILARYDTALREEIVRRAQQADLKAGFLGQRDPALDHGVLIPLYYLQKAGVSCPIVRMGLSGFSPLAHYRLGQCVAAAVEALGRRAVFVASGDLSHKLKDDGPYGFAPEGPKFDEAVTQTMASGDFLQFLMMNPALCERAAECGLRSFQMMAGALDGQAVQPQLLSHEGPFGVGYAVALFPVTGRDQTRCFAAACEQAQRDRLAARRAGEDAWVRLARLSLETYIRTGSRLETLPEDLPDELTQRAAGAFVSLHLDGRLRGCIGTISPTQKNVAQEIVRNAVSAGTRDPRFPPVHPEELDALEYSVDVLGAPEPVDSPAQLDPKRYGVIVSCGTRRGLLLPDLDGVDTAAQQIEIAREKGGIRANEPYRLERFEVVRHV